MKNSKFVQIKVFSIILPLFQEAQASLSVFLVKDTLSSVWFMSALNACTGFTRPAIMEKMGSYCPKSDNQTLCGY